MLKREIIPRSKPAKIEKIYADTTPSANKDKMVNTVTTQSTSKESNSVSLNAVGVEVATDCMICSNPFMQDWQHPEYNICPSCREKLRNIINGV
jgi:Zn finger protein HypA/HybF involved in hydrogenase expression